MALRVLSLNTDVEAFLIEVGSRFIIVELFKLGSDYSLLLEAIRDLAFSVKALRVDKIFTELEKRLLGLLEPSLFPLVELVFLLQLGGGLDLTRGGLGSDVEEINVCLQESLLHELDGLGLSCNLLLQFKVVLLLLKVGTGP